MFNCRFGVSIFHSLFPTKYICNIFTKKITEELGLESESVEFCRLFMTPPNKFCRFRLRLYVAVFDSTSPTLTPRRRLRLHEAVPDFTALPCTLHIPSTSLTSISSHSSLPRRILELQLMIRSWPQLAITVEARTN